VGDTEADGLLHEGRHALDDHLGRVPDEREPLAVRRQEEMVALRGGWRG
jgi:hypothetical protein